MTVLAEAPEILVCCGHCGGEGAILEAVQVYEAGCGFSHDDVASAVCPVCQGEPLSIVPARGDKVVTNYWRKPGPTDQFDWCAWFDNDEPNDNGHMLQGYGRTESAAIEDLLQLCEDMAP